MFLSMDIELSDEFFFVFLNLCAINKCRCLMIIVIKSKINCILFAGPIPVLITCESSKWFNTFQTGYFFLFITRK